MQRFRPAHDDFLGSLLVALVTFAAITVLAMVLARWTWVWFAPDAEPRRAGLIEKDAGIDAATHRLFGTAQAPGAASTGLAVRLLGIVVATTGRPGYALVQFDGKGSVAAREGEDIAAGIRLVQIGADHVVLERGGVRERLEWPKRDAAAAAGTGQ